MNSTYIYAFSSAFLVGVVFSYSVISRLWLALLCLLVGIVFLMYIWVLHTKDFKKKPLCILALIFIGLGTGNLRSYFSPLIEKEERIEHVLTEHITAEGLIIDEPQKREKNQQFGVGLKKICIKDVCSDIKEKVLVRISRYEELEYGDLISITGSFEKPEKFETDTGRLFDYPAYLAKENIYYIFTASSIEITSTQNGNFVKRYLFIVKQKFLSTISELVPQPHASLLGGMTLGGAQSFSDSVSDVFRRVGIIHIVVLSGYNITLVADALLKMLSFTSRTFSFIGASIGIILFAIMTGGSATIVRASIMGLIVILGRFSHRPYDMMRALMIAGSGMVLHNPKILLYDPSFQLSFLATLGLIYGVPICERVLKRLPVPKLLQGIIYETIATQIFVLPLLLYISGELSIVALPVNLLVLWVVPIAMFLTFITAGIGFIYPLLAFPIALLAYGASEYIFKVAEFFNSLSFASVSVSHISLSLIVSMYILGGIFVYVHNRH